MSRDRARRRAAREAEQAVERARRERQVARSAARRARRRRVGSLLGTLSRPRPSRGRGDRRLAQVRLEQDGLLLAAVLAGHVALWLWEPSWWVRLGAAALTLLALPVLHVLLFDRRPSR